jgi:hypothetical protein
MFAIFPRTLKNEYVRERRPTMKSQAFFDKKADVIFTKRERE